MPAWRLRALGILGSRQKQDQGTRLASDRNRRPDENRVSSRPSFLGTAFHASQYPLGVIYGNTAQRNDRIHRRRQRIWQTLPADCAALSYRRLCRS